MDPAMQAAVNKFFLEFSKNYMAFNEGLLTEHEVFMRIAMEVDFNDTILSAARDVLMQEQE